MMAQRRRDPAYCFGVAGRARAPWRPSVDEARADAIEAGFASRDEVSGTIYLDALADIWVTYELVPAIPREAALEGRPADRPLSRIERIIARREGRR